jgi:hypothetical protein
LRLPDRRYFVRDEHSGVALDDREAGNEHEALGRGLTGAAFE